MTEEDGDLLSGGNNVNRKPALSALDGNAECFCCGASNYREVFTAQEKMFGTHEPFEYFECGECASLQIRKVPSDLNRHYPPDYYSMAEAEAPIEPINYFRRFARAVRTDYHIGRVTPLGWAIDKIAPNYFQLQREWFRGYASTSSRILDVGCGAGSWLRVMYEQGFHDLTGVDPFIERSIDVDGLKIIKGELADLDERFDFVMLHHSLEHMPNPLGALGEVRRLLKPRGVALVRLPVAGSYAQRRYGINWIGLDPPRHLFVPSRSGMYELAERAGFSVARYWFDGTGWDLLISEAMARGFPPYDREKRKFLDACYFTAAEIEEARKRMIALNRHGDGDLACFILRRAD